MVGSEAYKRAGVDIDAGKRAVELMRSAVRKTHGPEVKADLGYFGGIYVPDVSAAHGGVVTLNGHALVASADGVGTKLKLAFALGTHRSIGHDIVNHCINDILACGAKPLFFLDYIATGKIVPEQIAEVVTGMAEACQDAGCALLGGETAEMPGMYLDGEYDVAGFIVGSVPRERLVLGKDIALGDAVFGLPSSGLHTNGYTLARRVFGLDGGRAEAHQRLCEHVEALGCTLGEALTTPHRSYLRDMLPLLDMREQPVKGMAHITGGGLIENIPRVLPVGCAAELFTGTWEVPPLFKLIESRGRIDPDEMARVFNMGIGMVVIVAPEHVGLVRDMLPQAMMVGRVVAQETEVRVVLRSERGAEG